MLKIIKNTFVVLKNDIIAFPFKQIVVFMMGFYLFQIFIGDTKPFCVKLFKFINFIIGRFGFHIERMVDGVYNTFVLLAYCIFVYFLFIILSFFYGIFKGKIRIKISK